jgi:hypothetical protein
MILLDSKSNHNSTGMAHTGEEESPFRKGGYFLNEVNPMLLKIQEEKQEQSS